MKVENCSEESQGEGERASCLSSCAHLGTGPQAEAFQRGLRRGAGWCCVLRGAGAEGVPRVGQPRGSGLHVPEAKAG